MGRRRSFDEVHVIACASKAFTHFGYEGCSVDDLVAATGIGRASLYGAFGSKHGLFLQCLDAARVLEPETAVDLILVALLERAPTDESVRARCAALLDLASPSDPAHALGLRLLDRSGLGADAPLPSLRSTRKDPS